MQNTPTKKIKIAPSILNADFTNLRSQIQQLEQGGADWIHLDVMDGKFVPNITFGTPVISSIRKITKLPLDAHLMVENADAHLESFARAGCNHITVHVEACPHLYRTIQTIKKLGMKAGVTLNPATSALAISEIISEVDIVLVMTVEPGFGGQEFISGQIVKVETLGEMIRQTNSNAELVVDGGVNEKNIQLLVEAGATVFVAGYSIFGKENIVNAVRTLKRIANGEEVKEELKKSKPKWQQSNRKFQNRR
ncbi:MAG: ribulose-phosphate 3-epimerase [Ignavibacteriales bacterium]|nr:ribulose-phosphate 3-epimerase [Ignavibacteriales bacterium]